MHFFQYKYQYHVYPNNRGTALFYRHPNDVSYMNCVKLSAIKPLNLPSPFLMGKNEEGRGLTVTHENLIVCWKI